MHTNIIIRSFIICALSLCLSSWSVVLSAAAAAIVVTTDQDVVDPPFKTGGLCGSGTVADLPGADGQVSLREAIHAANHTPGEKSISFAPNLNGATIVLTGPLYLCGGHTTLTGDVNGDNTPDVTIDGNAVIPPFDVIGIVSSYNTVQSLRVLALAQNPLVSGLSITATPAVVTTVLDNTIAHNIVHGVLYVGTGTDEFNNRQSINDVTVKHVRARDNEVSGSLGFGVLVSNNGNRNVLTDLTITGNTVFGNRVGISVRGGWQNLFDPNDDGATDNRLDVTIKDNLVTGNSNPGDTAGISILGGFFSSSNNQVNVQILNNTITNNNGSGVSAGSGLDNSSDNDVAVTIRDNTLENNAGVGIGTYGGFGALVFPSGDSSDNILDARIERNTIKNASLFGLAVLGGLGSYDGVPTKVANNNAVTAVIKDNTVMGTVGEGMLLSAGGSSVANTNDVEITVKKNTVCGSAATDIHVIGGFLGVPSLLPPNQGAGNTVAGKIIENTSTVVVEDGVAGNSATITQFNNDPCS